MPAAAATAHDFSFTGIDGADLRLADYKGRVVLLVNTASMCGFCTLNYSIDFPMTDITSVKGPNAHPYYKWIADVHGSLASPRWNFHKHVIDSDGKLVDWFASTTSPKSNRLRNAIETALKNRP